MTYRNPSVRPRRLRPSLFLRLSSRLSPSR